MLKLRGFDAGKKHHFDAENDRDVYDGQLDTRACDYGQHFLCKGTPIQETLYSGYKLPADQDDGRIDFFDENLNITEWNIEISPVKHPDYARAEEYQQIDPRIKIALTAKLSPHVRANKL